MLHGGGCFSTLNTPLNQSVTETTTWVLATKQTLSICIFNYFQNQFNQLFFKYIWRFTKWILSGKGFLRYIVASVCSKMSYYLHLLSSHRHVIDYSLMKMILESLVLSHLSYFVAVWGLSLGRLAMAIWWSVCCSLWWYGEVLIIDFLQSICGCDYYIIHSLCGN